MFKHIITTIAASAFVVAAALNVTVSDAQAFGLSDITNTVKKSAKAVGDVGKRAGKAVGREVKSVGKSIGRDVKHNAKRVGSEIKSVGKSIGRDIKHNAGNIKKNAGKIGNGILRSTTAGVLHHGFNKDGKPPRPRDRKRQ